MPALHATAGDTQFGEIPNRGTGHASIIFLLAQAVAAPRTLSFGVLFLDVAQAFYRTLWELLLRSPLDDDAVACVVRAAGLPTSAMHELVRRIRELTRTVEQQVVNGTLHAHTAAQISHCYHTP
eukprot:2450107-Pyramimonas_sp.AAC.1